MVAVVNYINNGKLRCWNEKKYDIVVYGNEFCIVNNEFN